MAVVMTIAGTVRVPLIGSLQISATASGRDTLVCDIYSEAASYRPALDDEVVVVETSGATSGTSLLIGTGSKTFTVQAGVALVVGERVRAYSAATPTSWMEGKITSYAGTTFVVSVDTTSGAGTLSDWVIGRRIFGGIVMNPAERGLGDRGLTPIVTRINCTDFNQYADRRVLNLTIAAGTLLAALQALDDYLTPYGVTLDPDQVTGPSLSVLTFSFTTLLDALDTLGTLTGYVWEVDYYKLLRMFQPGSRTAPFNLAAGDGHALGDVTVEPTRTSYVNRVLVLYKQGTGLKEANNAAEQAAHGLWEIILNVPDLTDGTAAQDLASAYLVQHTPTPDLVRYETRGKGLLPGETQTINLPARNVNTSFLLTEIVTTDDTHADGLRRRVSALEGSVYQPGWRDVYKQWSGGGSSAGSVIAGGGGATAGRRTYFLGGSSTQYAQSAVPDWIAASGEAAGSGAHQVTIDTVALGDTTVTVTVRLRAASGSVTARLRNVSDGTTVGTSAAVALTTWQTVTFTVTLTAGTKIYELQLLPSVANTDVAAVGYLE